MKKISELLSERRKEKGLSVADVVKETKIKKVYIEAIEEGRLHDLPSESYARGFVKTYATFLGYPEYKIIPLFRREYESQNIDFVPKFRRNQHKFNKSSVFSPRGLLIMAVILLILAFVSFQYSSLFFSPQLTIETPTNGQIIEGNVVTITGETDPDATLLIEGEEVYVGLDGKFRKSMYSFTGEKKITIRSTNRFGKQTQEVVTVKVQ